MKKMKIKKWKYMIFIISILLIIFLILVIFYKKITQVGKEIQTGEGIYENYYVIMDESSDDILWESIAQGALEEGRYENRAYVDYMEDNEGVEFSLQEKLRIAIDSKVDGIIINVDETPETTKLIDEAIQKDIPVVTVLTDDAKSDRTCYIGVNNYSLGEEYGRQIWKWAQEVEKQDLAVTVFMDANDSEAGNNSIYLGLKDYVNEMIKLNQWIYEIDINLVALNRIDVFDAEESIREVVLNETPDMVICLNARDTEAAYRTVVDYNKVGEVDILGYYESEGILEAVEKEVIKATITVNGEQVGSQCVKALQEYQETQYVSEYFPVDIQVIDKTNVAEYLMQYDKEE